MRRQHELKIWPEFFRAIADGQKTFEIRVNDRDFRLGDLLVLNEWDQQRRDYTGQRLVRVVTYIAPLFIGAYVPAVGMTPTVMMGLQPELLAVPDLAESKLREIVTAWDAGNKTLEFMRAVRDARELLGLKLDHDADVEEAHALEVGLGYGHGV